MNGISLDLGLDNNPVVIKVKGMLYMTVRAAEYRKKKYWNIGRHGELH